MRSTAVLVRFPDIEPATIEFRAITPETRDLREYRAVEEVPAAPTSWAEAAELVRLRRGGVGQKVLLLTGGAGALVGLGVWALFDAGLLPF
jgi:hypothetical protein